MSSGGCGSLVCRGVQNGEYESGGGSGSGVFVSFDFGGVVAKAWFGAGCRWGSGPDPFCSGAS